MREEKYRKIVNKNTLECWSLLAAVFTFCYIIEVIKGVKSLAYVLTFIAVITIPLAITAYTYSKDQASIKVKTQFIIGAVIMYAFVMFTATTPAVFVYILPMASILLMFGDKKSVMRMFACAIIINVISVVLQITGVIDYYVDIDTMMKKITFWEIQFAAIILTICFSLKACSILMNTEKSMDVLMADAYTDPLTLLKNVRFKDEYKLTKSYVGDKDKFSLSFIDIDNFKSFNTNYGHEIGDIVIHEVCKVFLSKIKDIPGTHAIRNGGDEFLIVSETMESDDFRKLNQDICSTIEKLKIYAENKIVGVTVSIGISTKKIDSECLDFADFYAKADDRNQQAKDAGKNQTVG